MAYACRSQVQSERRAQTAGANEQHSGAFQLKLPFEAYLGHDEVAAVAQDFFFRKLHFLFRQCVGRYCHGRSPLHSPMILGVAGCGTLQLRCRSSPPAMDGTMLIVSPSLVRVFSFSRNRMSSSFRYTFTKLRIFPSSV